MNLNRRSALRDSACLLAACTLFALMCILPTPAFSQVWWNNFPRIVGTRSLAVAKSYWASAAMNSVAEDPGWGLWFTFGNDDGTRDSSTRTRFEAAGIASLSYNEGFGTPYAPIGELQWNPSLQRWTTVHQWWDWQGYGGGPIVWAGAWTWFDSFKNDPPSVQSELSYFARPYTRMNAIYGGGPMLYPDGTVATGFLNNDTNASDPRDSRVYDAGAAKNIHGELNIDYEYSSKRRTTGLILIPSAGKYTGNIDIARDPDCPCWTNYTWAETLAATRLTGLNGTWTDNFSPWDSFMSHGPVRCAFGEWSVALFRNYLTNKFTADQLANWGVLPANSPLSAITNFDVRAFLLTTASNQYNLTGTNLSSRAWANPGWLKQPVWSAYKIFRRQNGSAALANYDHDVHAAAARGGQTNFALLANDLGPCFFGWARGTYDLGSTELNLGQHVSSGKRGFGLPPYARVSPFYKAVREGGRSQFVTVWLYNDNYTAQLTNSGLALTLFYEMLATDTLPKFQAGNTRYAGTPDTQMNFFRFVADGAAPVLANRVPVEEVGIYLSTSTILAMALPKDALNYNAQQHQYAVWGWGTALSQLHYQYGIVPEWKLSNLLPTLKVLIIPNAEAFEPADVATLQIWVSNGGSLIVTGDSGSLLGESGNFAATNTLVLSPLTGVATVSGAPARKTNFLGSGVVSYYGANVGYAYYNASASARATQLATFATALSNAYAVVNAQPVLASSNAPTTMGLTLYQGLSTPKMFVDVNNFDVASSSPYVVAPTLPVEVDFAKPVWLNNGLPATATIVSPDGALKVTALTFDSNRVHLQLPSVTNYMSVILQQTPAKIPD